MYKRHKLSHQQIDDMLGDKGSPALEDKLRLMDKLQFMLQITRILHDNKRWFMLLKGPLLSQRIYDDPCYRYYGDFDLLCKEGDVAQVVHLLLAAGFQAVNFQWPEAASRQQRAIRYHNQYPMYHPEKDISVEIHWRLFKYHIIPRALFRELLSKELEQTTLGGQVFLQFRHEMELLYLVIHGGIHAWWRLKWLVDIREMLMRQPLKEPRFLDLTKQLKAGRQVALCNALLRHFFPDTPLMPCTHQTPSFLLSFALERIRDEKENPHENLGYFWRKQRYRLSLMPGFRYQCSTFKLSSFSQSDMHHPYLPPIGLIVIIRRFLLRLGQLLNPTK